MKNINKLLSLKLVILFLLSFSSPIGMVLCYGEDGHVELEKSLNGSCAVSNTDSFRENHKETLAFDQDSPEHCGPCKDFPIFYSEPTINRISKLTTLVVAPIIKTISWNLTSLSHPSVRQNRISPLPFQSTKHIRSTILLI